MACSQRLDLETVIAQLEEEFVSAEGEYEAFEEQETLATAANSDGEPETTSLGPVSPAEQVETVHAREGEEDDVDPLNHRAEGTILPHGADVDSTTRDSTVRIELSFEDKEEDDAIAKFVAETCGCTLGPKKSPCSSQLSRDTITLARNNCLQLT